MSDQARDQLDLAASEVLGGQPVRATARKFGVSRSTLVRVVERARTSTPKGDPPIPPGATLPSPLEVVLRRLDDLESMIRARAALEEIPAGLFDDLGDGRDDELKGGKSSSSSAGA